SIPQFYTLSLHDALPISHEHPVDGSRAAVREVAILETPRQVEAQGEVVTDLAVNVAPEVVLAVPGRAVPVISVFLLAAQGQVVPNPIAAAAEGGGCSGLQGDGLDDRGEPVGVGIEPRIRAVPVLLAFVRRIPGVP